MGERRDVRFARGETSAKPTVGGRNPAPLGMYRTLEID